MLLLRPARLGFEEDPATRRNAGRALIQRILFEIRCFERAVIFGDNIDA